jgi:hypothetical protein
MDYAKQYPQISIFQSFKAKVLQLNHDPNYQTQLKKAAIFSPDRTKLYKYLIQPQITQSIQKVDDSIEDKPKPVSISAPSPLEKYTTKPQRKLSKEELNRKQLEKEILQHAVASSIILEVGKPELKLESSENLEKPKIEITPVKQPENFDQFGALEWLRFTEDTTQNLEQEKSANDLISTFIESSPKKITLPKEKQTLIPINRPKAEFFSPENLAKMSLMEDEDMVTETLARIYAGQGNISKATKAYEKLSLKFPEKSDYFARLKKELSSK